MSIAKNTQSRKKVAPQNEKLTPKVKKTGPQVLIQYAEKYPNMGVIHETEIRLFLFNLPILQLRDYGGRFHALIEVLEAARQRPSAKARRGVARLIADLEKESRNRRYRQILQAMAAAVQSEKGMNRAYWTALRVLEMTFEWTNEYLFAFCLYKQWLKQDRQPVNAAAAVKRTKKLKAASQKKERRPV
jgi:hypothetical protein